MGAEEVTWKVIFDEDKQLLTIRRVDDGREVPKGEPGDRAAGVSCELAVPGDAVLILDHDKDGQVCAIGLKSENPMQVGVAA